MFIPTVSKPELGSPERRWQDEKECVSRSFFGPGSFVSAVGENWPLCYRPSSHAAQLVSSLKGSSALESVPDYYHMSAEPRAEQHNGSHPTL